MNTIKTVVFVSNFFNHHQKPFSDAMYQALGDGYLFIETARMSDARKKLGWKMDQYPPYVVPVSLLTGCFSEYKKKIDEADVVIIGAAPNQLVANRLVSNKLVFRYSERPLKKGLELWKYPYRFISWRKRDAACKRIYMLCASAYTARDYALFGMYKNRCYKWGYFPKTERYEDVDKLIASKKENSMVWVARYLEWKHPEIAVEVAGRLRAEGYDFELNMIGDGVLMKKTAEMVKERDLEDAVHLLGAMKPEEVRRYMEQSQIHLFTSDRNEGWGAVLNESMNSACVPVANVDIGSAPYLIENGKDGYVYSNIEELYSKVKYLLDHKQKREEMAKAAYAKIVDEWNANTAAERLMKLVEGMDENAQPFASGVCSKG